MTHERREMRNETNFAEIRFDKKLVDFRRTKSSGGVHSYLKTLSELRAGDCILISTAPPSAAFLAAAFALRRGAAFALLMPESYLKNRRADDKNFYGSLTATLGDFLNRWLYKYAAAIYVFDGEMKSYLEEKTRGLDVPVKIVPHREAAGNFRFELNDEFAPPK